MSNFSQVKNVRIASLTEGAVVQLRLGKAAVRSADDLVVVAKVLSHGKDGEKFFVTFEETSAEGVVSETVISRFPGAPWRSGQSYVSLVGVDESTFTIQKPASPIQTDAVEEAIKLVKENADDVYGDAELVALLTQIAGGKRINADTKALANKLAKKLVDELANLPDAAA